MSLRESRAANVRFMRTACTPLDLTLVLVLVLIGASSTPVRAQCDPGNGPGGLGPDVIVGDLLTPNSYGQAGDHYAYAIGTTSCNIGTEVLLWEAATTAHPVIAQNMYRLRDGRFEQVGMSWLKHGFSALFDDICGCNCVNPFDSQILGVGCSDPYSSGLNGNQTGLGPRSEVNDPAAGLFGFPVQLDPVNQDFTWRRLRVHMDDVDPAQNVGALYFVEGHYLAADDSAAGNAANNASYRQVAVGGDPDRTLSYLDTTRRQLSAIHAWQEFDPSVVLTQVLDGSGGILIIGAKVTDLGGGEFEYEYAVHNLNSTRAVGGLSISLPGGVLSSSEGFHDVDYHSGEPISGTDWTITTGAGEVRWETESHAANPNANALRFSTLYNYRFRANATADLVPMTLELFTPGTPSTITAMVPGPAEVVPLVVTLPNGPTAIVAPGGGTTLDLDITPIPGVSVQPGTALLHVDTGSGFTDLPLTALGGTAYRATFPAAACGSIVSYYLSAQATSGAGVTVPAAGASGPFVAESAYSIVDEVDDLEIDLGWFPGPPNTATAGNWTYGDPNGTNAQPEDDHTIGAGVNCWFTGQGTVGGFDTEADVDGGVTTLYTNFIDTSALTDPTLSYWRWFSNDTGANPSEDVLVVEISTNGLDWVEVETVGPSGPEASGQWFEHTLRVLDFAALSPATQLRFTVGDLGGGSVVEAAIDDVRLRDLECGPQDCNGNGLPDDQDIASGASLDCDGNAVPDECDLAAGGDCDGDGALDACEIASGAEPDCNGNGLPDACDIAGGTSADGDASGIPDECEGTPFIRGDINQTGGVDISDAVNGLGILFSGGAPSSCPKSLDVNADGATNIADPISLLTYLFAGGPPPAAPFPLCGLEPATTAPDCATFSACP
ncbi:MAG: hypothetical protein ACO4B4_11945 [Planctomycetota bacterium]